MNELSDVMLFQVDDLSVPPCTPEHDTVNITDFWTQVEKDIIAKGLCEGAINKFRLKSFMLCAVNMDCLTRDPRLTASYDSGTAWTSDLLSIRFSPK